MFSHGKFEKGGKIMNDETLRRCSDCANEFQNAPKGLKLCRKSLVYSKDGVKCYLSSDTFRNQTCGISGIFFTQREPTLEQLETIFDD